MGVGGLQPLECLRLLGGIVENFRQSRINIKATPYLALTSIVTALKVIMHD